MQRINLSTRPSLIVLALSLSIIMGCGRTEAPLPTTVPITNAPLDSQLVQPDAPPTVVRPTDTPGPSPIPSPTIVPIEAIVETVTATPQLTQTQTQTETDKIDIAGIVDETVSFVIDPAQSSASFSINEVLLGADKTVVGTTDQLSGRITFNPTDPSLAVIDPIVIKATGLETDEQRRNRALQTSILQTGDYPDIVFFPKTLIGLPPAVNPGQPHQFDIVGDLTIRNVTQSAIFSASVTWLDANTITGEAESEVNYETFGLTIPSVPIVASVEETVRLKIEFTATR